MKRIMLVCNAGMSTGILAKRMQEESNGELEVFAVGDAQFDDHLNDNLDLILVGPQIRHLIPDFSSRTNVKVIGIKPQRYGLMDAKGVLSDIKEYL